MDALTEEGRKLFGKYIWYCAEKRGFKSQKALSEWLTLVTGYEVPESQINTLIKARWERSFHLNYLFAVLDSGLLSYPNDVEGGRLFDYSDVMEILRGRLDPFTGEGLQQPKASKGKGKKGKNTPFPEAIAEICRGLETMSEAEYARRLQIPISRLRALLAGELPTFVELLKLASYLYDDKSADRLGALYGYGTLQLTSDRRQVTA